MGIPHFDVALGSEDGCIVVSVDGELDFGAASMLQSVLHHAIECGTEHVIVDMGNVTFLDSEGVKVLLQAHNDLCDQGREMILRGCRKPVMSVFGILGLDDYLDIEGET